MHNAVGGTAPTPIDLLMGLVGQRPIQGPFGSDEFNRVLGLFGPIGSSEIPSPEGGVPPLPQLPLGQTPDGAVVKIAPIFLPQELAKALGLKAEQLQEPAAPRPSSGVMDPMVTARATMLPTDDGQKQTLHLMILPGETMPSAAVPEAAPEEKNGEEMMLPIRLRTVEQFGNRIFAEGELQTATGREVSIRLRLELAGNPSRIQEAASPAGQRPVTAMSPAPMESQVSLPRLLSNLDVQSLVIEPATAGQESAPGAIIPKALPSFIDPRGFRTPISRSSAVIIGEVGNQMVNDAIAGPQVDGSGGTRFAEGDHGLKDRTHWKPLDDFFRIADTGGNPVQSVGKGMLAEAATISIMENGAVTAPTETSISMGSARFYNLDAKLDQLKSNPGQKITIQMIPSQLGKMELSIVSHRGLVTVNLILDSPQAKQAVEKNLAQLESRLASSGIRVDNFQIHVNQSSRGAAYAAQHYQHDHYQGDFSGHRGRGFQHRQPGRTHLQQFSLSDVTFEQAMVNCLA